MYMYLEISIEWWEVAT